VTLPILVVHGTYIVVVGGVIAENYFRIDKIPLVPVIVHFQLETFHQLLEKNN